MLVGAGMTARIMRPMVAKKVAINGDLTMRMRPTGRLSSDAASGVPTIYFISSIFLVSDLPFAVSL